MDGWENVLSHALATKAVCLNKLVSHPKLQNKYIHFECSMTKNDMLLSTFSNDKAQKSPHGSQYDCL